MTSCDSNVPSTHARRNATFKFEGAERAQKESGKLAYSLVLLDGMYGVLPRSDSNLKTNARVDVHVEEKKPKF